MIVQDRITPAAADLAKELSEEGAGVDACYQCRKCTSGCPVAATADIRPHELVRLVQLGQTDSVLSCRMIWACTSCQTCITRCPQKVDIAAMNDLLRQKSQQAGKVAKGTTVPTFNGIFLRTIRRMGRMYEMGLMTSYKMRTLKLWADVSKFPMMLFKRKLSVLPTFVRGGGQRKKLFQRAEKLGGKK